MRPSCHLSLSNGQKYQGHLIGAPLESSGELVFTTGMVGYSEALTDPSYFGQILVFTYPLIGNYGIPSLPENFELPLPRGFESGKVHTSGVIVTVDSPKAFHWNSFQSLDNWLKNQGVPGIIGLDTRHLVHEIRANHGLLGRIQPENSEGFRPLGSINPLEGGEYFDPAEHLILPEVSTSRPMQLGKGDKKVAILDCGVKWNIVRQVIEQDCQVELVPWDADLSKVDCDAWLLSNGPGDPGKTGDLKERIRPLLESNKPILGICLGHQMLCLAAGAKTTRMPYGHRSHNQPVYLVGTRKGFITSQNHGFVVADGSLPDGFTAWFRNANDQSIEGVRHLDKPHFSVQFHPESAGGPRDTGWIIQEFVKEIRA